MNILKKGKKQDISIWYLANQEHQNAQDREYRDDLALSWMRTMLS